MCLQDTKKASIHAVHSKKLKSQIVLLATNSHGAVRMTTIYTTMNE